MTEKFEEIVGATEITSYTATYALMVECGNCGAPIGIRCMADPVRFRGHCVGRRTRRIPCLRRILDAAAGVT